MCARHSRTMDSMSRRQTAMSGDAFERTSCKYLRMSALLLTKFESRICVFSRDNMAFEMAIIRQYGIHDVD